MYIKIIYLGSRACQQRWMDEARQKMVCVCSAEKCDPLPKIEDDPPKEGKIAIYISSQVFVLLLGM